MKFSEIERSARELASNRQQIVGAAHILSIAVFPLTETLLIRNAEGLWASIGYWLIPLLTLILIAHVITGWLSFVSSRNESFYFEYVDLQRKLEKVQEQSDVEKERREQLETSRAAVSFCLEALGEFITYCESKRSISAGEVHKWLKNLLLIPVKRRAKIFNYVTDSRHNIAVYLYSDQSEKLEKFYREADSRIEQKNRPWRPGFGHIGLCFQRKKAIISPDILKAPELSEDLVGADDQVYRSIATVPIFSLESTSETADAKGVFIVTSDVPGQLTEARHQGLFLIFGRLLSLFFHVVDQNLDKGEHYAT